MMITARCETVFQMPDGDANGPCGGRRGFAMRREVIHRRGAAAPCPVVLAAAGR